MRRLEGANPQVPDLLDSCNTLQRTISGSAPTRPSANARTWSSVAIVVSPGKVVSSAPCAQPSFDGVLRRLAGQQAVEESGGEAVAAADAVEHVELARRRDVRSAVDPGHGAPACDDSSSGLRAASSRRP